MEKCKGIWVRVTISHNPRNEDFCLYDYRIRLIRLKRKTCPGCPECTTLLRELHQEADLYMMKFKEGKWYRIFRIPGGDYAITEHERKCTEEDKGWLLMV